MHSALLGRSLAGLNAVREQVTFSGKLRSQISQPSFGCQSEGEKCFDMAALFSEAPDATNWRVIDHCIVITQAYALFEAFVTELLGAYLQFLAASCNISEIDEQFVAKYTRGIGQILVDQGKARYENIDIATLIADASAALTNKRPYQIQPEALLRSEQNLRMDELQRLFKQCGLSGVDQWVTKHDAVISFFASQSRLSQTVDSELQQIIDYRNEAAHGDIDQVLGTEILVEVTEFFEVLLLSIAEFVQYDTLRRAKMWGKAEVLGSITERYQGGIVVAKVSNSNLKVGEKIYVNGKRMARLCEVKSIQLDDVNHDAVEVIEEREVGLKLDVRTKVGCELIRFN